MPMKLAENRETLIHRASEQEFARTVEIAESYITKESVYGWKQFDSHMQRMLKALEFSKFKISSNSERSREDRVSDRNRSVRICRNFGNRSTRTVTTSRKFEVVGACLTRNQTVRTTTNSKHFLNTKKPRAQTQGEHSTIRYKAAPKPKLFSIGFSQRNWRKNTDKAKHKGFCASTSRVFFDRRLS